MTSHYLDIHLRHDPEITSHQLMSSLCSRLHQVLVRLHTQEIGVSFPEHDDRKPSLGTHLRLHGSEAVLRNLVEIPWLHGLQDHLQNGPVTPAPATAKHRLVSRVQAKSSAQRLRRRAIKRHGLSNQEALARIPGSAEERLQLPFVAVGSRSTAQPSFPLFIRHGPLRESPLTGTFSAYGLSQHATVPWF